MNESNTYINETGRKLEKHEENHINLANNHVVLVCKYDDILSSNDHIRWYFNRHRIRSYSHLSIQNKTSNSGSNQHTIVQIVDYPSKSTYSKLIIENFNPNIDQGRYHCGYRGLIRSVRVYSDSLNANSARFVYKQSIFSMLNFSTKNLSSMYTLIGLIFFSISITYLVKI